MLLVGAARGQVIEDFDNRFQAQQNGGIVFLANTTMYCGTDWDCTNAQQTTSNSGSYQLNNNSHDMEYYDGDTDPDTWCSASDSLALGTCAEISFAGLYWAGRLGNGFVPNENIKDQVKIRAADGDPYIDIVADEEFAFDASGVDNYCCFADITEWVAGNPVNARYTVGNVVAVQSSSSWGGWVMVVVYEDALSPMRNLTVFDGLAMITSAGSSTVDVPISGFLTPPLGPVDLQLGVVAYDGDRGEGGDQLGFNGTGTVEYIEDATHDIDNAFNSSHSTDGVINPWRLPAFNNTLGHDANIFVPDNSAFDFLPNNATDASIRVTTGGESITVQVITSVIDVYEPDLRANVFIEDLDGGVAEPGDILQYTVVGKNLGSDAATGVYMTKALDIRTNYVPGSLQWVSGPLSGAMTDAAGDDAGTFNDATQTVEVNVGGGANAATGGTLDNDPLGLDSIAFRFQVQLTDDCLLLQCDGTLTGTADIFGEGDISGNAQNNGGASALFDANGCPVDEVTVLDVQTGVCPPVFIEPVGTTCLGDDVTLVVPEFASNPLAESLANYSWTGPAGFTGNNPTAFIPDAAAANTGNYLLEVTFTGLSCLLSSASYNLVVHEPAPDFTPPASQCLDGNSFDFTASGAIYPGAEYTWSFDSATPSAALGGGVPDVVFNAGGWHEVQLTLEEIGCTASFTDSILIEVPPVLTPFAVEVQPTSGCVPLTVSFADADQTVPLDYGWTFGDGTSTLTDEPTHEYGEVGTFGATVSVVSLTNCPAYLTFEVPQAITVLPNPVPGFDVEPTVVELLQPLVNITSTAADSNAVSYWMADGGSLGSPSGTYIFSDGGTFEIVQTVTSPDGCTATATGEVVVNGTIFHAPSGFTPNNDGLNDTWHPVALGVTSYALEIRNRWGETIWATQDPDEPWQGQGQGSTHYVPNGLYHWQVTYTDQLGLPVQRQGTFTMIR